MAEQPNTPEPQEPKRYLSIAEVAALYGIGESTIYRNVRLNRFPRPLKICGMNRWDTATLPGSEEA